MIVPNDIKGKKPDWHDGNKRNQKSLLLFSFGAYTPVCSNEQLPDYEKNYDSFQFRIDEVYLCNANDFYVTEAWLKSRRK